MVQSSKGPIVVIFWMVQSPRAQLLSDVRFSWSVLDVLMKLMPILVICWRTPMTQGVHVYDAFSVGSIWRRHYSTFFAIFMTGENNSSLYLENNSSFIHYLRLNQQNIKQQINQQYSILANFYYILCIQYLYLKLILVKCFTIIQVFFWHLIVKICTKYMNQSCEHLNMNERNRKLQMSDDWNKYKCTYK